MDKKNELFDFQSIITQLKEKHDGEEKFKKFIEGLNEHSTIEDMPFYKEYLSKFEVERAFDDFNLTDVEDVLLSKDDLFMLCRLIVASFSSSYDILYDKQSKTIDLSVSVKSSEQFITKKISELWSFQIMKMFDIYVNEQIELSIEDYDPEELEDFKDQRKIRLMIFEKKVRQIHDLQGTDETLAELDDLLNS